MALAKCRVLSLKLEVRIHAKSLFESHVKAISGR